MNLLENIEQIYPGLKELLRYKGISVRARDQYKLRTAIVQRGEQSINRDAKTTGGIKSFAVDNTSVLKWTLNRPKQARNTAVLLSMAGMQSTSDIYKPLRPSQILKSEVMVTNVVNVLSSECINPFDSGLDKDYLVSRSSGVPLPDKEAVERILILRKVGEEKRSSFTTQLREMSFHFSAMRTSPLKLRQAQRQKLLNSIETLSELYLHIRPEMKNDRF